MAEGEKPYRVYRGGRVRGRLPALPRPSRTPPRPEPESPTPPPPEQPAASPAPKPRRRRRRYLRWTALVLGLIVLFLVAWGLAGYFSFRDGVTAANKRLPRSAGQALDGGGGFMLTSPSTILLLGTDHARGASRRYTRHSDSIMLVRTDPDHHRIYYLSIPRDLYVPIPGYGSDRINTAFQAGGAGLAIRTVRELTGLEIEHVVVVDFSRFKDLIDEIGGIDVDVPKPILSSRFDCPYKTQARCQEWDGWRFEKGRQHMDGRRALIYSRVRSNRLDPADNDVTRAERQQQVLQAISGKLAGLGTFFSLPFIGDDLLEALATDLTPSELLELGWVKWRSGSDRAVHCRLGGDPETIDGASVIRPSEENRGVVAMVRGESAPQPPPPGSGTYGPGCVVGSRTLGAR